MGSKNKIAKDILPIILKDRKEGQWYVEPFCGGLGTLDKVDGNKIGADNNKYLIAMWNGLKENKDRPYYIPKELYDKARIEFNNKTNIEFDDFMIGWIGFMGSFNGRFFDGGYSGHMVKGRNYISEQIRNTERSLPYIDAIDFIHSDYKELKIPTNSIIYCDPPYKDTKQYSTSRNFNHKEFWNWCIKMSKDGHKVFVSEYQAPKDFVCIWSKEVTNSLNTNKTYKPIERLFTYKNLEQ